MSQGLGHRRLSRGMRLNHMSLGNSVSNCFCGFISSGRRAYRLG
jgi:hypothetical protein